MSFDIYSSSCAAYVLSAHILLSSSLDTAKHLLDVWVLGYAILTNCCIFPIWVKVQFRGPELFQEESYLPWIFRSSSINLHTFHLIHIVFWWQIFFRKHDKSTPNDLQDHHILVVDVVIMTSQCRCTRALSQSHVAKHDNHVTVAPLIGSGLGVMAMQWLPYGKIISAKTLKLLSNRGHPFTIVSPTCSQRLKYTR